MGPFSGYAGSNPALNSGLPPPLVFNTLASVVIKMMTIPGVEGSTQLDNCPCLPASVTKEE